MRWSWIVLVVAAALAAGRRSLASSQEPATAPAPAPAQTAIAERLRLLAPLVGPVWSAPFPGGKLRDEQEFAWVFGGRFLRNVHRVVDAEGRTVYEGETIYAVDPRGEGLAWWYWNSTGGYVTGTATLADGKLAYEGENHAPGQQIPKVRGALELGEGRWTSRSWSWTDGAWKERMALTFLPLSAPR